jgi:hypothetical protein
MIIRADQLPLVHVFEPDVSVVNLEGRPRHEEFQAHEEASEL